MLFCMHTGQEKSGRHKQLRPLKKSTAFHSSVPNVRRHQGQATPPCSPPRKGGSLQRSPLCENLAFIPHYEKSLGSDSGSDCEPVTTTGINKENKATGMND